MTRTFSAPYARAARLAAAALALLALATLTHRATAAPTRNDPPAKLAVSLLASAPAIPVSGSLGYTGLVRFLGDASSVSGRLQVRQPNGRLIYQRTQYVDGAKSGTSSDFPFSRQLSALSLNPGTYPVTFTVRADVDGSLVTTEVTTQLRVYNPSAQPVSTVVLAKVHTRPLSNPNGAFATDPGAAEAVRARDQVDSIATLVNSDASARVVLAIAPVAIEEWRRLATSGYTLASGTVVVPSSPVPLAYAATLTHLQQALATSRLELVTMGYSDPNLSDLSANKLAGDAALQYDMGLSAIYASLETTPSEGSAPAGGCVPKATQHALISRHVTYTFADADCVRLGKKTGVPSGAYPVAGAPLTALVVDARASRGLESGDASATLARSFDRVGSSAGSQPFVVRIDLDDTIRDTTATVGAALTALEGAPWVRLKLGEEVGPPKGAKSVTYVSTPTQNAPAGFWPRVRSSRAHANGMIAVLSASNDQATGAETDSLIAEGSTWSEPAATWAHAADGLAFANQALKTSEAVFGQIKLSATSVTLAGATGQLPVNIQNGTKLTMTVAVRTKTSTGISVVGTSTVPTKLAPGETYVQIPLDMSGAVSGKVTVEVLAGNVIVSRQTVTVHRSFLDRLALVGGIVIVLAGLLGWIVVRVRRSPDVDEYDEEFADDADEDSDEAHGASDDLHDAAGDPRYTEARSETPEDSDRA